MQRDPYAQSIEYCEDLLAQYGDSALGVGWPRQDAATRYRVMLDLILSSSSPVSLLDFGCGASHLYEFIRGQGATHISYEGLDLSDAFLSLSQKKFPEVTYHRVDVLDPTSSPLPPFDYVVMNGIFTYRGHMSDAEMFDYLRRLVVRVFDTARVGIAFNVMSKQVDQERSDLFHLPVDSLLTFLSHEVSRHVVIRHDYGLYEYTAYVYRTPTDPDQSGARRLVGVVPMA